MLMRTRRALFDFMSFKLKCHFHFSRLEADNLTLWSKDTSCLLLFPKVAAIIEKFSSDARASKKSKIQIPASQQFVSNRVNRSGVAWEPSSYIKKENTSPLAVSIFSWGLNLCSGFWLFSLFQTSWHKNKIGNRQSKLWSSNSAKTPKKTELSSCFRVSVLIVLASRFVNFEIEDLNHQQLQPSKSTMWLICAQLRYCRKLSQETSVEYFIWTVLTVFTTVS